MQDKSCDGIPGAVDALEAAFLKIDRLTSAEKACAAAEIAYRLAAEAQRDVIPPLEHILIRDSLCCALASLGYAPQAHAIASHPMPGEPGAAAQGPRCALRLVGDAPEIVVCAKGETVVANDEKGRTVRGVVAWAANGCVAIRRFDTNETAIASAAGVVRNVSRSGGAGGAA